MASDKEETRPIKVRTNEGKCSIRCSYLRIDVGGPLCIAYNMRLACNEQEIYRGGHCLNQPRIG